MTEQALTPAAAPTGDGGSQKLVGMFDMMPKSLTEAMEFSKLMAKSELVPVPYRNKPQDILIAVQKGVELGLTPLVSLDSIAVINGRAQVWGDAVLAIVRRSGVLDENFGEGGIIERPPDEALMAKQGECTVKRKDSQQPTTRRFSMAEAEQAGLLERSRDKGKGAGPWVTYPGRMLQMRARSWALRDACPEVLKGLHIREEGEDHVVRDLGRARVVMPARTDRPEVKAGEAEAFLSSLPKEGGAAMPSRSSAPVAATSSKTVYTGFVERIEAVEVQKKDKTGKFKRYTITLKDGWTCQTIQEAKIKRIGELGKGAKLDLGYFVNEYGNQLDTVDPHVEKPATATTEEPEAEGGDLFEKNSG